MSVNSLKWGIKLPLPFVAINFRITPTNINLMAYLDIAAICSKVEELVFKLRGRLPVDVLTDQVHKFVGVLVKIKHFCAKFPS